MPNQQILIEVVPSIDPKQKQQVKIRWQGFDSEFDVLCALSDANTAVLNKIRQEFEQAEQQALLTAIQNNGIRISQ